MFGVNKVCKKLYAFAYAYGSFAYTATLLLLIILMMQLYGHLLLLSDALLYGWSELLGIL